MQVSDVGIALLVAAATMLVALVVLAGFGSSV